MNEFALNIEFLKQDRTIIEFNNGGTLMNINKEIESNQQQKERVLLALLPFWTPLIPPLGISTLKSYLQKYGHKVITVDANTELDLWDEYYEYNDVLKKHIPNEKKSNFYNIGHNVLRNHLMAYLNHQDKEEYINLMKEVILQHYFCDISNTQIYELDNVAKNFFSKLENYLINLIDKYNPTVIGLSVYTGTLPTSIFAFKLIKKKYPHIKTVMGGGIFADQLKFGTNDFSRFAENTPYIDKIIIGEGEILFAKYLGGKLSDEQKVYTLQDNNAEVLDFITVDICDFSDFNINDYTQLASYASRSCPFQCQFCSETTQWGKFRKKDTNQVVDELSKLSTKHKFQLFLLGDSLLNPFITELSEELINRNMSIYLDGYLRADKHVSNIENTLKWRAGGFYRARLGVESGSQRVLNLMDKRITIDEIRGSVSALAYAGIKTTTYWVIGFPGETEEDFQQTLDLIEELKDDIWEADCNPFSYFIGAQAGSDKWQQECGISRLYPEYAAKLLMSETWVVNAEPRREVIFDRVRRFAEHCKKLGIPNPYSLHELYLADKRWEKLHKNSVPNITMFKNKNEHINENKIKRS